MTYEQIGENVDVLAEFKSGSVLPRVFKWRGKNYPIERWHLSYQERNGAFINYYYSVETGGSVYKLSYKSEKMTWFLEEVYVQ